MKQIYLLPERGILFAIPPILRFFLSFLLILLSSLIYGQACENCLDWGSLGISGSSSQLIQTFNNVSGTGIDMTLEFPRPARNDSHVDHFEVVKEYSCDSGDGEVIRFWKPNDTVKDTLKFSWSEPVVIDQIMLGGQRQLATGVYGRVEFFLYDGPNCTGNVISPDLPVSVGANDITTVDVSNPDPIGNTPINILSGTISGETMGGQNAAWLGDHFESVGLNGNRPWVIFRYFGVAAQSAKWIVYEHDDPDPGEGNPAIGNISVYWASTDFCPALLDCSVEVINASPTTCDGNTNLYDLDVEVIYANQPVMGGDISITVDDGSNPPTTQIFPIDDSGSETFTIIGLDANEIANIDVTATFDDDIACTHTLADAFDAPGNCNFDLALTKMVNNIASPGPYYPGGDVAYTINVINQGEVDAFRVNIQDYIPAGMSFLSATSGAVTTTLTNTANVISTPTGLFIIDQLVAGDDIELEITLRINVGFTGTTIRNWAEIRAADSNMDPSGFVIVDKDSTPNAIIFSEPGETDDLTDDNVVNQDGKKGGDEDDHDPAEITIQPCPFVNCFSVTVTLNNN